MIFIGDGSVGLTEFRVDCVNRMAYKSIGELDAAYEKLLNVRNYSWFFKVAPISDILKCLLLKQITSLKNVFVLGGNTTILGRPKCILNLANYLV